MDSKEWEQKHWRNVVLELIHHKLFKLIKSRISASWIADHGNRF